MADISFKFKAEALGKSLENLGSRLEGEILEAVKNLAHSAYASVAAKMQASKSSLKQDYLKALKFMDLGGGSYMIYLDGEWANKLEDGYGSYSVRELLLKSQKIVKVGSRSGEPWVRKAEDGHKYAAVPFTHRASGGAGASGDLGSDIKKLVGQNALGQKQRISKIWKDIDGNPLSGKVAIAKDTGSSMLEGLVKYQHVSPKGKVSSVYMTYRMVSEKGKDWVHPGFKGYGLMAEAQEAIDAQMDEIIQALLK